MGLTAIQKVRRWIAEGKIANLGGNEDSGIAKKDTEARQAIQNAEPTEQVTVLIGNALEKLRELPDKSVHCCVTSPPYFGLRDYQTEPLVWGGENGCEHEWGDEMPCHHPGQVEQTKWKNAEGAGKGGTAGSGRFCQKCGAWRGSLGLETTPELYVQHLVEIFREVKRVLRDDGTLWLNLGDSYNAHPGQRKETDAAGRKQQSVRGSTGVSSRNVGDLKPKDLIGIPWRAALALQRDGWYLRSDIIWAKGVSGQKEMLSQVESSLREHGIPDDKAKEILADLEPYVGNCMPESVTDRPTRSHEYVFMLAKSSKYYFDNEAIKEEATGRPSGNKEKRWGINETNVRSEGEGDVETMRGIPWSGKSKRNRRDVWTIPTKPFKGAHFAVFPVALIEPMILAGCPKGGTVLDPFGGSGTTGEAALKHGRRAILVELNPEYESLIHGRIQKKL